MLGFDQYLRSRIGFNLAIIGARTALSFSTVRSSEQMRMCVCVRYTCSLIGGVAFQQATANQLVRALLCTFLTELSVGGSRKDHARSVEGGRARDYERTRRAEGMGKGGRGANTPGRRVAINYVTQ